MEKSAWTSKTVTLRFKLGEISLGGYPFHFLVYNQHFTELDTNFTSRVPPLSDLGAEIDGVVLPSHPVEQPLPRLIESGAYLRYVPMQFPRYFIDLRGDFEGYLRKFSSKSRSTLQRKVHRYKTHSGGSIDWRLYRTPDEVAEFHRLATEVSRKTYQERLFGGGLPENPDFLRQEMERARAGDVRAYLLFHTGRPVAYLYCPVNRGAVTYEYLGYDPEYARWSVGTVLQHLALEQLFAERRFRLFDFTEGDSEHKRLFSTGSVYCADLWFYRRQPRSELLVRSNDALFRMSRSLVKVADQLKVKKTLKKWIRGSWKREQDDPQLA